MEDIEKCDLQSHWPTQWLWSAILIVAFPIKTYDDISAVKVTVASKTMKADLTDLISHTVMITTVSDGDVKVSIMRDAFYFLCALIEIIKILRYF